MATVNTDGLNEKQARFWRALAETPGHYAHRIGRTLAATRDDKKQFNQIANEAMRYTMDHYSEPAQALRILQVWLTGYNLPFVPQEMLVFDAWQKIYSDTLKQYIHDGTLHRMGLLTEFD